MYKGIAGSEGIGIGNVAIIEEHQIVIENKTITDADAEIARLPVSYTHLKSSIFLRLGEEQANPRMKAVNWSIHYGLMIL